MAQEEIKNPSEENTVRLTSDEDVQWLMDKYDVSEEDVNVAIQIIGRDRERVEKYLAGNRSSRFYNIW